MNENAQSNVQSKLLPSQWVQSRPSESYLTYLEAQVDKFASFMLTQKKLNEKHLNLERHLFKVQSKLSEVEVRLSAFEIAETDIEGEIVRVKKGLETYKLVEARMKNLESEWEDYRQALSVDGEQKAAAQVEGEKSLGQKSQASDRVKFEDLDIVAEFQKQQLEEFREQVSAELQKIEQNFLIELKKVEIQLSKSKESILRLSANINSFSGNTLKPQGAESSLSRLKNQDSKSQSADLLVFERTAKNSIKAESLASQPMATKKELKKMEKKLESYFDHRLQRFEVGERSENSSNVPRNATLSPDFNQQNQNSKFRRIQEKFQRDSERLVASPSQQFKKQKTDRPVTEPEENCASNLSKTKLKNKSQKNISIFDNQFLNTQVPSPRGNSKSRVKRQSKDSKKNKKGGDKICYYETHNDYQSMESPIQVLSDRNKTHKFQVKRVERKMRRNKSASSGSKWTDKKSKSKF